MRPRKSAETVIVRIGSTIVYESVRTARVLAPKTLKAGHTFKFPTAWSGKPNQTGIKNLSPGTYTITVDDSGYGASTTVQLVARHRNAGR
jgi:hypothetical protein